MNPGDVILIPLLIAAAVPKLRPAVYLASLPGPFQTILVCGIGTQLTPLVPNWDELIQPGDADFAASGLHQASVIRLSFLRSARAAEARAVIGSIDPTRLHRLRTRLADRIRP